MQSVVAVEGTMSLHVKERILGGGNDERGAAKASDETNNPISAREH